MAYDNVCKLIAEKYPTDFAEWLLNEKPRKVKVLKTELSIEPIRADSVIFLQTDNRILHIEFQTLTTSKPGISFRVLDYSVRLKRTYNLPVTQVVIFLQETSEAIAFTEEYVDETTTHCYRALRMWEQDPAIFVNNAGLLPLASLAKTDLPQTLLSQVAGEIAKIPDRVTRQNTAAYTEILAGLRFEKNLIRRLLSEDIMQESVIYQDILQKGKQQEAFQLINIQLNRRFQQIDSSLIERVRVLSTEQLENLAGEFVDFSQVSDLEAWLNQYERS